MAASPDIVLRPVASDDDTDLRCRIVSSESTDTEDRLVRAIKILLEAARSQKGDAAA